jgi:membrane fusion protein (multidrug efflux system)
MRSLHADGRSRRAIWFLLIPAAVLAAWTAWFLGAHVSRYEVTDRARLEVNQSVHLLQAPIAGRVMSSGLVMGREIREGDVVLELDAAPQQLQLQESKARLAAVEPQVAALRAEIAAQEKAQQEDLRSSEAALDQARAQVRDAEAQANLATLEAERNAKLRQAKLIAERDYEAAQATARSRRAAVEAMQAAVTRQERDLHRSESDRRANIEDLRSQVESLEGDRLTTAKTIDRLAFEITRRRVLAPVSGRFGEVTTLRPGGYVVEGDKLGAIVPSGDLRVIAEFAPPAALGRIHAGQPAEMRLQGFPWTQFGSIPAHVTMVGGEIRDGTVRVELAVDSSRTSIPLQHGLPGTVEVQVENVSPATLLLRAAGQMISTPKTSFNRQSP